MGVTFLEGQVNPNDRESIAAFYQYYTNGKMTLTQAAKDYGISGLTAAFYVKSFQPTKAKRTTLIKIQSKA